MALTAHRNVKRRNLAGMLTGSRLVETAASVYVGSLLVADATTGLAKAAADAGAAATVSLGICTGFKFLSAPLTDSAVVGNGTIVAEYETNIEVLLPCAVTVTAADNMKAGYALDDEQVTDVSTAGPGIGLIVENESATQAWVHLGRAALPAAT